ncbi:hypothetical protein [Clostridium sp.]|uniref:hypothetical protein n=1 Tax=Clostridium sp. TaxID=1506 RepID=UPI00262C8A83|nr:hypothetical protein [Clostridium sp.]
MDKEEFKETEEKVKRYYQKEDKIKSINKQISLLKNQVDRIEKDLRDRNFSIDPEQSSSSSFEERVQSSSNGACYAEREIIRVTEIKIKRIEEKKVEIERLEELKDIIDRDSIQIEDIIIQLNDELKNLLEMKYKKKFNEYKISQEVHLSQSQVNKKIRRSINAIQEWNNWREVILE